MGICIIPITAIRIRSIAVTLDIARIRADEAGRSRSETGCLAGSDVVGEADDMARVAHEDGGFHHLLSGGGDRDCGTGDAFVGVATTAVGVVEDLSTLEC